MSAAGIFVAVGVVVSAIVVFTLIHILTNDRNR